MEDTPQSNNPGNLFPPSSLSQALGNFFTGPFVGGHNGPVHMHLHPHHHHSPHSDDMMDVDYDGASDRSWETESGSAGDEMDVEMEVRVDTTEDRERSTSVPPPLASLRDVLTATQEITVDRGLSNRHSTPFARPLPLDALAEVVSTTPPGSPSRTAMSLTQMPTPPKSDSEEAVTEIPRTAEEEEDGPWKRFEILPAAPPDHAFLDKRANGSGSQSRQFMMRLSKEYNILGSSLPGECSNLTPSRISEVILDM